MPAHGPRTPSVLVLVGILALAFNLRPAAVSVGPVLPELSVDLGMTPTGAGVLTSLPVLAFAVFGALTPRLARALGGPRTALVALVALGTGLLLRALAGSVPTFLALSLVALGGMAVANVLLPALVKEHAPERVGALTSAYTTALSIGLTSAFVLTVPLSSAAGSWRGGLAAWAVAAGVAALPWGGLLLTQRRRGQPLRAREEPEAVSGLTLTIGAVARTRLGWAMALCFGLQSLQAYAVFGWFARLYRDAGFSASTSGLLLGVVAACSIPVSLVAPRLAARSANPRWLFAVLLACYAVGYVGLLVAPRSGGWVWAVFVGVGTGVFPLVLTLVGLRARTTTGTSALSGFTQSAGYLLAALGPFGIGILYGHTGDWTWPLVGLLLLLLPLAACASYVSRPLRIEDQVRAAS